MQLEMTDNNSRRMVEVLWGLFGFLFVMVIFCITLWPLINAQGEMEKKPVAEQSQAAPAPIVPPTVLAFVTSQSGQLLLAGKPVADNQVAATIAKTENPQIELTMGNRHLVNLFYQCSQHGLAPTVKLQ